MKRSEENDLDDYAKRKKLTIYGWLGIPVWLLTSIFAMFIMLVAIGLMQAAGFATFITMTNGAPNVDMTGIMLLSVSFGMLAYPLIWCFPFARRQNRFVHGYGIRNLKERLHCATNGHAWMKGIGIGILCGLATTVAMTLLSLASNPILEGRNQDDTTTGMVVKAAESLRNASSPYFMASLAMVISAFLIGPICEELLFRGLIGMSFRDSNMFRKFDGNARKVMICVLSGALFGLLHFQGGDPVVSVATMMFTGIIGTWFSWLALYRFDSVVPTMAAHVTYNSVAVILSIVAGI